MNQASELDVLDYRMSKFNGGTFRAYTGSLPGAYATVPGGTVLASFTVPSPAMNPSTWNSGLGVSEATLRSTWQDQTADNAGTFGCYTVTDAGGTIIDRGTMGVSGSGAGCIVNAATIAAGAPFSIIEFTTRQAPMP